MLLLEVLVAHPTVLQQKKRESRPRDLIRLLLLLTLVAVLLSGCALFGRARWRYETVLEAVSGFAASSIVVGESIYISTSSGVDRYINGARVSQIEFPGENAYAADLAIGSDGLIYATSNSSSIYVIDDGAVAEIPGDDQFNYYGIAAVGEKLLLRHRGDNDSVSQYDIASGTFVELFALAATADAADDIAVLEDAIFLNRAERLAKYDHAGNLLAESDALVDAGSQSMKAVAADPSAGIVAVAAKEEVVFFNTGDLSVADRVELDFTSRSPAAAYYHDGMLHMNMLASSFPDLSTAVYRLYRP